jgi:hypothetical protein
MANVMIRFFSMDVELSDLPKKGTRYDRVTLKENINTSKLHLKLPFEAKGNTGSLNGQVQILNIFKKGSYDYVELEFSQGAIRYGQKTMKFSDFVKQNGPLKKYFEDVYNDYKFAESNATKELHKQLKDKQQGETYWKQKAEQLEQDLRDEKTRGIVDYMKYEREIGEQQKAKETAQKEVKQLQKDYNLLASVHELTQRDREKDLQTMLDTMAPLIKQVEEGKITGVQALVIMQKVAEKKRSSVIYS